VTILRPAIVILNKFVAHSQRRNCTTVSDLIELFYDDSFNITVHYFI